VDTWRRLHLVRKVARAVPDSPGPAIVARDLRKSFGKVEALRGLSLTVEAGRIVVILGPNGAGKTTLVRILATLLRPDSGQAMVAGRDVVRQARALRGAIGLAGQYAAVDEHLTGRENLQLVARLYHRPRREAKAAAAELLRKVGLEEAADRTTKGYSGGMRRRLDLAAALIGNPEVLFLDEPTSGLDPPSRLTLWAMVEALRDEGRTIVLTTQHLEEAERLADRVVVVDQGTVIAEGTVLELKSKVGGDLVELVLPDAATTAKVAARLKPRRPQVDGERNRVRVAAPKGAQTLAEVVAKVGPALLAGAEVTLRRPTLDDVFLTLTGHTAAASEAEVAAQGKRRGKPAEAAA
jgi:ABC-2 type transport system ATP-binding protein